MKKINGLGRFYGDERLHGRVRYFITKECRITSGCSEGLRTGDERVRFFFGSDEVLLIVGVDDDESKIFPVGNEEAGPERERDLLVLTIVVIGVITVAGGLASCGDIG